MSIDNILAKIIADASAYADGLISDANNEAERILAKAKSDAEAVMERAADEASKDAVTTRHRKQALAELEARKMRLAAKQQAVASAMDAAASHIANIEPEAYVAFLAGRIAESGLREGQLLLNARDKEAVGNKLVQAANELIMDGKISLSDQTIPAIGGFVLKTGSLEINSTIETMVGSVRDALTPEVVAVLFQAHEGRHEEL